MLEDGRPQEIRAFSVVDIPVARPVSETPFPLEVEPDVTTNAGRDGRLYVILLDAPSTARASAADSYEYTMRAKQVARQFVDTAMQPGDQVAVVHVQGTFTDSQPFTTSRRLIAASIDRYGRGLSGTDSLITGTGNGFGSVGTRRNLDTYRAIEDLAARLGTIRGRRKAIIWIGGQISIDASATSRFAYRDAMRAAARNDVAIYPVDPVGTSENTGDIELSRTSDLRAVAEATGGLAVVGTSNFTRAFGVIIQDLSLYYLLGYTPDRESPPGTLHSIQVRVKRPGVTVRSRRTYYTESPAPPRRPGKTGPPAAVSTAAADALARPLPTRGLRVDVVTSAFKTSRRECSVVIAAHVDGHDLHLDGGASLTVLYKIFDVEGKQVAGQYKVFSLTLRPATRDAVAKDGLRFLERVSLRPGRYELRLVAEQPNVALGSVNAPVEVVEMTGPLAMSGVVLATAAPTTTEVLAGDATLRTATAAEPVVLRRFTTRDTLVEFFETYTERADEKIAVVGILTTPGGIEIARGRAQDAVAPLPDKAATARGHRITIDLHAVPPGEYVFTTEARFAERPDRGIRRQIPVVIE